MPSPETFADIAPDLIRFLVETQGRTPIRPYQPPGDMEGDIPGLEEDGQDLDTIAAELRDIIEHTPCTNGPAFFNQLFGGRDSAAALGEITASLLNSSMYTYKVAGPHALIERRLIDHMGAKIGWNDCDGIFNPGGSLSNLVGAMLARASAFPQAREEGMSGCRGTIYTSSEGHYSIVKNASIVGVGRANVRHITTDREGRMDPNALLHQIEEDRRAGFTPMMINATAATTVMGAFDPIEPLADIAGYQNIWLHVDGAFGSSLLLSPKYRDRLTGIEKADSVTWNAHKMMGVPMHCSVLITRHKGMLREHIGEGADYLFQTETDDVNFGTRSIQCGRRNDVLKLWAAWRFHGDRGYAARIERQMDLVRHCVQIIEDDPAMVLSTDPQSLTVCFEVASRSSRDICDELDRRGLAKVGHGIVNGRRVIRLVCINPNQTAADFDAFFGHVRDIAASLPDADNDVEAVKVSLSV